MYSTSQKRTSILHPFKPKVKNTSETQSLSYEGVLVGGRAPDTNIFLGQISLTPKMINSIKDGEVKSFPLEKRSTRSHISGQLSVSFRRKTIVSLNSLIIK